MQSRILFTDQVPKVRNPENQFTLLEGAGKIVTCNAVILPFYRRDGQTSSINIFRRYPDNQAAEYGRKGEHVFPGGKVTKFENDFDYLAYVKENLIVNSPFNDSRLELENRSRSQLSTEQEQIFAAASLRHLHSWMGTGRANIGLTGAEAEAANALWNAIKNSKPKIYAVGRRTLAKNFNNLADNNFDEIDQNSRTQYYYLDLTEIDAKLDLIKLLSKTFLISIQPSFFRLQSQKTADICTSIAAINKQAQQQELKEAPALLAPRDVAKEQKDPDFSEVTRTDNFIWDNLNSFTDEEGTKYQIGYHRRQGGARVREDIRYSKEDNLFRPMSLILRYTLKNGKQYNVNLSQAWFNEQIKNDAGYIATSKVDAEGKKHLHPVAFFKHDANSCNMPRIQQAFIDNKYGYKYGYSTIKPAEFRSKINPESKDFDLKLHQEYNDFILKELKKAGASKGKSSEFDFAVKLREMNERAKFIIPDINIKEYLIEILCHPGRKQLLRNDGAINQIELEKFLKTDQKFKVRAAFLELIGAMNSLSKNMLSKQIETIEGEDYVVFDRLPAYIVKQIIEKSKSYKTLNDLVYDYTNKSRDKLKHDKENAWKDRNTYLTYNYLTQGLENRYSIECYGLDLEGRNAAEADKMKKISEAKQRASKAQNNFENLNKQINIKRDHTLLNTFKINPANYNALIDRFKKDFENNFRIATSSYPGFAQFVWPETLVFVNSEKAVLAIENTTDNVTLEEQRKTSQAAGRDIPFVYKFMFGGNSHPEHKFAPPIFDKETNVQKGIKDIYAIIQSKGLDKYGLEMLVWHERFSLRIKESDMHRWGIDNVQELSGHNVDKLSEDNCKLIAKEFNKFMENHILDRNTLNRPGRSREMKQYTSGVSTVETQQGLDFKKGTDVGIKDQYKNNPKDKYVVFECISSPSWVAAVRRKQEQTAMAM